MAESGIENQNLGNSGDNAPTSSWWEAAGISEDILPESMRSKYADINAFAKGAVNAQSMIGKAIPDENTPDEARDAFYAKLGRPESPDKYSWTPPEGFDVEGVTSEHFKEFKELAFKNGITDKQLSAVMGGWSGIVENLQKQQADYLANLANDSKAKLSSPNEWGDKYDENLNLTFKKIEELGVMPHLKATGILYDAAVLKAFYSIVSEAEESRIKGSDGRPVGKEERLNQIRNSPAYFTSSHPDHAAIVKEFNSLLDG